MPADTFYVLPGHPYNLEISFPWYRAVAICVRVVDKQGALVQGWETTQNQQMYERWKSLLPAAKFFIDGLFGALRKR